MKQSKRQSMHRDVSSQHTFVVLAHGESPFLEDCLRSLAAQTLKSTIMMVTSTPSAKTRQVAERYGICYGVNKKSGGIADDWNFAMRSADTPYVTLAHQDDIYEAEYVEGMLASARAATDALITFSDYVQLDGSQKTHATPLLRIKKAILSAVFLGRIAISSRWAKRLLLSFGCPICCPSVMYRREMLVEQEFHSSFEVNLDWKYWIDLTHIGGAFVYVRRPLLTYRAHQATTTSGAIASGQRKDEDLRCFKLLWPGFLAAILSRFYALSYSDDFR